LLKTAIIGVTAMRVASSWIDILAGLLPIGIRKTPPVFSARAGAIDRTTVSKAAVA
jgi:hypothetical protein